jgi:cystathionine beta-lyase
MTRGGDRHTVRLELPELAALHQRRSGKWSAHPPDVLVSTIAEMDFGLAEPIAATLHAAIKRGDLGYAPRRYQQLARAFAGFAERRLQWTVDPDQVTLVPDVMVGLVELCCELVGEGEAVAFPVPAYPPFFIELRSVAPRIEELALTADGGIDEDGLKSAFNRGTRALILTNPHNPTGRVAPRAELVRLADFCAERGIWVLADEIHAPLTLAGAVFTPFLEVSDAARQCGISLTSASKAFNLAGLKASLIVAASTRAREAVAGLPDLTPRCGLLGILAAETAFEYSDAWLDRVLIQLAENRALLDEQLSETLPAIQWRQPDATYLAWLDCRRLELGDDPAAAFLARGRVALSPGPDLRAPGPRLCPPQLRYKSRPHQRSGAMHDCGR